jgi:hypothetical protein
VHSLVGLSRVSKGLDRQGGNVKTDACAGGSAASADTAGVAVAVAGSHSTPYLAVVMLLRCGEAEGRSRA